VEDICRVCKADRLHTIVVVDGAGQPLRVVCGYCGSEHNFRGGVRAPESGRLSTGADVSLRPVTPAAFPLVTDRERIAPTMLPDSPAPVDLELLLRRIIREEAGVTPVAPAQKWRGGTLVLKPGASGLQDKSWPIETFFHKVVMIRNRLRSLEQHVNASDLPDDVKIKLQGHVSGCYGSLTSFNILFAEEDDHFKGGGSE
jgi:hypothetical protein